MKTLAAVAIGSFLSVASLGHEVRASVVVTADFDDVALGGYGESLTTQGVAVTGEGLNILTFIDDNFIFSGTRAPIAFKFAHAVAPQSIDLIPFTGSDRVLTVQGFDATGDTVAELDIAITGGNV